MTCWRIMVIVAVVTAAAPASAQDFEPAMWQPGATVPGGVQGDTRPADASLFRPEAAPVLAERLTESTWYTRVDYFHWNERLDGADFVNEYGVLPTLGYQRRTGPERFRFELSGATVDYHGAAMFDDGTSEPLVSSTNYLGVRGEYDLVLEPEAWPLSFVLGLGTRFWVRDLKDGTSEMGAPVSGYQETWWTIYPYLGVERRRVLRDGMEFYGSARLGWTAVTYQRVSYFDVTLYPKAGLTGQVEAGVRGRRLFAAGFLEAMTWGQSGTVQDTLQPASRMFTVGVKAGFNF